MSAPILVTGAGGCIGAWVIKRLRAANQEVVAFDLSATRRRLELLCDEPAVAAAVVWETGDIADFARVRELFARYRPAAVIHLAALQVPFCIADPVLGAQVNVLGTVNVFEAARQCGVRKIVYASSVAATAMDDSTSPWKKTLYGAYKICNEQTAQVYWRDWQVPSIGIRPSVVYGVARDQGMSAAPTLAMLAAVLQQPYTIPFIGTVGLVYADEAAAAFVQATTAVHAGAAVFSLNGSKQNMAEVAELIMSKQPSAKITCSGAVLPFPSDLSDAPLRAAIGDYWQPSFGEGVDETLALFARRLAEKRIGLDDLPQPS